MNKHIRSNRLLVLTILAALLILFTGTLEAFATSSPTHATVKDELDGETYHSKTPLDNDALFEGYIEDRLSLPAQLSAAKQRGTKLTGLDLKIYNSLKPQIRKVADGEVQSSVMTVTLDDLGLADTVWTAEDLGVSAIVKNNVISNEAVDALSEQLNINIRAIVTALLADCPYELYWYDKVTGVTSRGPQYTATHNGTEYQLKLSSGITYSFSVAQGYSDGEYKVNTTNAERVQTAVTNAKAIVQSVKFISDYSKLYNYKQEICRLVSYDSEAANNKNTPYGDSWQLISVFDGDDSTNVVCEGYSKAFQYLCELTTFSNDISCISVTGTMAGGTGAGSHMWNIVNMEDGENYLTDITNCDAGTVGADDQLFLAGYISGGVESGYTYRCNGNHDILYVFDSEVVSNYGDELVMSDHKYVNQDTDELAIDQTTFPDQALRNYVSDHFDVDQNTHLSSTELAAVREIDCSGGYNGAKVKDLSGIEVFSGLTKLCVSNNDLHSIIIPSTSRMKSFVCGGNTNLESIELGLQPELCVIDVSGCTSLTSLDLTKCASGLNAGAGIDLKVSDCTGLQQLKMPASLVYFGAGEGKRDRIVTTNCSALQRLEFTGDAPEFAENAFQAFDGLYVDYPLENTTWTNTNKKSYGGKNIEWKCEHQLTAVAAAAATCTEDGNIAFWTCNVCQSVFTDKDGKTQVNASDVMVKAKGHNFGDWYKLTEPTYDKEGIEERECQTCHEKEQRKLAKLPKVSLGNAAVSGLKTKVYTGNGQTQTPVVTLNGRSLKAGTDYILTYKNNVAVGTATVMINGKGKYGGTVSKSFVINPKPATIVKPVAAKKAITVKWQKMAMLMPKARITGYQIQYSTDRNFKKNVKTNTVIGYAKTSKKVGGLKPKKSYHVRVRTYMTTGGKTYFSAWSSVKSAKAK